MKEYDLEEINDLKEVIHFNPTVEMYIMLYPDSSDNHIPYMVISDANNDSINTKIARIRLDKPEYVYKKDDIKKRWILSEDELKNLITLLSEINYNYINNPSYFLYMIDRYNGLTEWTKSPILNIKNMPNYMELLNE